MYKYFANLIDEYMYEDKMVDDTFIYNVLDKLLSSRELTYLSSENEVFEMNNPFMGTGNPMEYSYLNGIKVYLINTYNDVMNRIRDLIEIQDSFKLDISYEDMELSLKYYYYIKIITMLMHEVEHVYQNSIYNNTDTLENTLITLDLKLVRHYIDSLNINNKEYIDNKKEKLILYKSNPYIKFIQPIERFANIKSQYNYMDIIENLNTKDEILVALMDFFYATKKSFYIYSYLIMDSRDPINEYIKHIKNIREYNTDYLSGEEIDLLIDKSSKDLSLKERLYYGYKVTDMELKNIKSDKIKIL